MSFRFKRQRFIIVGSTYRVLFAVCIGLKMDKEKRNERWIHSKLYEMRFTFMIWGYWIGWSEPKYMNLIRTLENDNVNNKMFDGMAVLMHSTCYCCCFSITLVSCSRFFTSSKYNDANKKRKKTRTIWTQIEREKNTHTNRKLIIVLWQKIDSSVFFMLFLRFIHLCFALTSVSKVCKLNAINIVYEKFSSFLGTKKSITFLHQFRFDVSSSTSLNTLFFPLRLRHFFCSLSFSFHRLFSPSFGCLSIIIRRTFPLRWHTTFTLKSTLHTPYHNNRIGNNV